MKSFASLLMDSSASSPFIQVSLEPAVNFTYPNRTSVRFLNFWDEKNNLRKVIHYQNISHTKGIRYNNWTDVTDMCIRKKNSSKADKQSDILGKRELNRVFFFVAGFVFVSPEWNLSTNHLKRE